MENVILKKSAAFIAIFFILMTNLLGQQTINNVQIGTNAPASGVNILANFPGYSGAWARGFSLSNQTGAIPFIEFGALGSATSGTSTLTYGYIGKDYTARHMTFYPNYNIDMGTASSTVDVKGLLKVGSSLSVTGDINMGAVSTIQSPTQLVLRSSSSYFNVTPTGLSAQAGTGTGTFSLAGNQYMTGSLSVVGDINMGTVSTIQSPTQLVLRSANSYFNVTPTGLSAKAGATGTGTFSLAGNQYMTGSLNVAGDITMGTSSTIYSPTRLYLAGGNMRLDMTNSGSYGVQTFTYSSSPAAGIVGGIYQFVVGNGYVKIGSVTTPNPAGYKLYVDQGILTEKVKVAVAGTAQWSDYVFAKDYQLMPLGYVEQYIKEHKHLPNVPSAEEMVKEGNDLGKTDAKLLEKIEELTLYLIELKKENELLKKRVESVEKNTDTIK
ncbi:MAG: hypothetical protein WAT19_07295 [Ferruginibacter sp.]